MKTRLFFLAAAFVTVITANAQKNDNARQMRERPSAEQMTEQRAKKMSETLLLDDKTSEKFIPLYKQYLTELQAVRPERRMKRDGNNPKEAKQEMTEEQIAERIKESFANERKALDIKEKYYKDFSKILNQKQIEKMYRNANAFAFGRNGQNPGKINAPHGKKNGKKTEKTENANK